MQRAETSLEERIRRLTCDVDENLSAETDSMQDGYNSNSLERRDSPAGEENPQQPKYDKSFSPSSSASSSSSGSTSAYRKITDIFNRDRRQERIPEADENPIVIIPQVCSVHRLFRPGLNLFDFLYRYCSSYKSYHVVVLLHLILEWASKCPLHIPKYTKHLHANKKLDDNSYRR